MLASQQSFGTILPIVVTHGSMNNMSITMGGGGSSSSSANPAGGAILFSPAGGLGASNGASPVSSSQQRPRRNSAIVALKSPIALGHTSTQLQQQQQSATTAIAAAVATGPSSADRSVSPSSVPLIGSLIGSGVASATSPFGATASGGRLTQSTSLSHGESSNPFSRQTESHGIASALEQHKHLQLTAAELRNMHRIFQEFDADKSGSIDRVELGNVMEAMGHMLTDEQLHELLEQVDVNNSGDLSFSEFLHLINLWKEACQFKLFDENAPSIQAQRIEQSQQTKLWKSDQPMRFAWDCVMLLTILYNWITVLMYTTLVDEPAVYEAVLRWTLVPDIVVSILHAFDIPMTVFTTQLIHIDRPDERLIDDPQEKLVFYAASPMMYFDLLAIVPIYRLGNGSFAWNIVAVLMLLKTFKVPQLFALSRRMHMTPQFVRLYYSIVPFLRLSFVFIAALHSLSVFWALLELTNRIPGDIIVDSNTKAQRSNVNENFSYVTALYFVLGTITTCGFGDVLVGTFSRQVAACFMCVLGTLTSGIVIGSIVSVITSTDIVSERKKKLRETLAVCEYFEVPSALCEEILQFQDHLLTDSLSESYQGLIAGLPEAMRFNISLFSRVRLISSVPYFTSAHPGTKVALAQQLEPCVYLPEQFILLYGDVGDRMFFIAYGFVDVIMKNGHYVATLKRGDFFGQTALLSRGSRRSASVKAITYCDLFAITRDRFLSILNRFPKFRRDIYNLSAKQQQELSRINDTNTTAQPEAPDGGGSKGGGPTAAPPADSSMNLSQAMRKPVFLHEEASADQADGKGQDGPPKRPIEYPVYANVVQQCDTVTTELHDVLEAFAFHNNITLSALPPAAASMSIGSDGSNPRGVGR